MRLRDFAVVLGIVAALLMGLTSPATAQQPNCARADGPAQDQYDDYGCDEDETIIVPVDPGTEPPDIGDEGDEIVTVIIDGEFLDIPSDQVIQLTEDGTSAVIPASYISSPASGDVAATAAAAGTETQGAATLPDTGGMGVLAFAGLSICGLGYLAFVFVNRNRHQNG